MAITPQKAFRISRVIFKAFRQYKRGFSLIIILGFLAGLFGAFGIGAIIPLFSVLVGGADTDADFITITIQTIFNFLNIPFTLPYLVLMIAFLFIVKGVIQFSARYLNQKISAEYENDMRASLFNHTLQSSWSHLLEHKVGYLEKVLMRDVTVVAGLINQVSTLILIFTSFITYIAVAFTISAPITIVTSLFGLILLFVFRPIVKKVKLLSQKVRDSEKLIAHFINEHVIGAKTVKTSAAEKDVSSLGRRYFEEHKIDRLKIAFHQTWVGSSFEPISFSFIAILLLIYSRSPNFEIVSFAAIIYLIQKIFVFSQSGQRTLQDIISNIPYVQSVTNYKKDVDKNQESQAGRNFEFEKNIEFKNIKFAYSTNKETLSDLNLTINKGEMVGLIGPSGSGKTTMVDLLLRLFQPDAGEILIDGENINKISIPSWRKNIGYMPQDTFLLNDTVENNVRFYTDIAPEDVIKATKDANIYEFIDSLPNKFRTFIGERGVKVSGGERQRIALARVLARKPKILILDEATSSLDVKSEALIYDSIKKLRGRITIIMIAHRLSTVMNADKVVVMDSAGIIEQGSPEELLNKDSVFLKLSKPKNE